MGKKTKRLVVNMNDWDLGYWPEDINKAIHIEIHRDYGEINITIALGGDKAERAVRKIASEAIESFLESSDEGYPPHNFDKGGLVIRAQGCLNKRVLIPWKDIGYLGKREDLQPLQQAFQKWLDNEYTHWAEKA